MSDLFRYNVEKLSSSIGFESEHQMESFLYNNPEVFGLLNDEEGQLISPAVIKQFITQKDEERKGRIDLLALVSDDNGNTLLKVIELKLKAKKEDFTQLRDYLEGLNEKNEKKDEFLKFIKENGKIEDEDIAEVCYKSPQGIFIVADFEPELIVTINEWNNKALNQPIELYKLLRFKSKESTYIVLDKILEFATKIRGKRADFSWAEIADHFEEIKIGDIFYIDKKYTDRDSIEFEITNEKKLVTLTTETINLMREKNYLARCENFGSNPKNFPNFDNPEYLANDYFPKVTWDNDSLKRIFSSKLEINDVLNEKITITSLVQMVLLANNNPITGWVWSKKIIHKNTNQPYRYFRDTLKEKITNN